MLLADARRKREEQATQIRKEKKDDIITKKRREGMQMSALVPSAFDSTSGGGDKVTRPPNKCFVWMTFLRAP